MFKTTMAACAATMALLAAGQGGAAVTFSSANVVAEVTTDSFRLADDPIDAQDFHDSLDETDVVLRDVAASTAAASQLIENQDLLGESSGNLSASVTFTDPAHALFAINGSGSATNYAEGINSVVTLYTYNTYTFDIAHAGVLALSYSGAAGSFLLYNQSMGVQIFGGPLSGDGSGAFDLGAGEYTVTYHNLSRGVVIDRSPGTLSTAINTSLNVAVTEGAVPEPATWSLMIAGFGLAGAGLRRRPQWMCSASN